MNDTYIVTTCVVIDDILKVWKVEDDCRATGHAAETLRVAVLAAKYFKNHHERALCLLIRLGYVSRVSVSRFNRQLHRLHDWLFGMVRLAGEVFSQGETFIIDSLPLPVCKRIFAASSIRLVSARRKNMTPNSWADDYDLAQYRKRIETLNSQLEAMGIQHLHARTNTGFELKAWASLFALASSNLIAD
jgi:hypothetical protein